MSGLPLSKFIPIIAVPAPRAFTVEKFHLLLAMNNPLIPSTSPSLRFNDAASFKAYFGSNLPEYVEVQKYFGRLAKDGETTDAVIVANWYKNYAASFIKGVKPAALSVLRTFSTADLTLSLNGVSADIVFDLSIANSYSDVANIIQVAINSESGDAWENATVSYSTVSGGFIIKNGTLGLESIIDSLSSNTPNLLSSLGLDTGEISQGVNAETWTEFCDRIYHANTAGYCVTTLLPLADQDILDSAAWLNQIQNDQTVNTVFKLVFALNTITRCQNLASQINEAGYSGVTLVYDPFGENVQILNAAIGGAVNLDNANGSINFNFQPAVGYTPVTRLDTAVDYQAGQTNMALAKQLDGLNINYVYSVGFGDQISVFYGMGLQNGAFITEDIQLNESGLQRNLQTVIMNGFASLNKMKLQGKDASGFVSSLIDPVFKRFQENGAIAYNGVLSDADRAAIAQATNNPDAADVVANNGYFFKIQPLTTTDIQNRRVRILVCYLAGGVVNKVQITNRIFQ